MNRDISGLVMRPMEAGDFAEVVSLHNQVRPEKPPMSLDEFIWWQNPRNRPQEKIHESMVALEGGRLLARMSLDAPMWLKGEDIYYADIVVDLGFRRQGIAAALYEKLEVRLSELRARKVYGYVEDNDPGSSLFAERRGFVVTGDQYRYSRLPVEAACLDGYEGLGERLADQGIRIVSLTELGGLDDESLMREVYALHAATSADAPGSEEFQMPAYEMFRKVMAERPSSSPQRMWLAIDRTGLVGTAGLERLSDTAMMNDFTGTLRAYRGRGIARALKARTIEWCRDNGVEYIYTDNEASNVRMLNINVRLGYMPLPASVELMKPGPFGT